MSNKKRPPSDTEIFLTPNSNPLTINGKILYNEGAQAWNIIRLKKEILHQFPELKEKRGSFIYKMIIPRTKEELEEHFKELIESGELIPIFLFFGKDQKEEN